MTLQIWDAGRPEQYDAWVRAWSGTPNREVFNHPDYVTLFGAEGDRALCAFLDSSEGMVLYPFIRRAISVPGDQAGRGLSDIISPYGYGGPQAWALKATDSLAARFWEAFDEWAMSENIVSEFIRFGLFTGACLPYPGEVVTRSTNIVVSLDDTEESIWGAFESKVRKNVKKARRSEVTISVDETGAYVEDFLRIYEGTMDRRDAAHGYYFPRAFFETINDKLLGQFAYFHAWREGVIISTELVLVSDDAVYSFLGGTDISSFEYRPNDLLKFEVISWARANGRKYFVLGGGASPGDGIERYKRSFAPSGSMPFVSGQRILDSDANTMLVNVQRAAVESAGGQWADESSFFPAYRRTV